jgi:hypothetical protein
MRSQDTILVVKCKTAGCESDLQIDRQVFPKSSPGLPDVVPFHPWEFLDLTCSKCMSQHRYERSDVFEKAFEAREI